VFRIDSSTGLGWLLCGDDGLGLICQPLRFPNQSQAQPAQFIELRNPIFKLLPLGWHFPKLDGRKFPPLKSALKP
jgi:hypothetical protein